MRSSLLLLTIKWYFLWHRNLYNKIKFSQPTFNSGLTFLINMLISLSLSHHVKYPWNWFCKHKQQRSASSSIIHLYVYLGKNYWKFVSMLSKIVLNAIKRFYVKKCKKKFSIWCHSLWIWWHKRRKALLWPTNFAKSRHHSNKGFFVLYNLDNQLLMCGSC